MHPSHLIGDDRLRSGGFSVASRPRRGHTLWRTRGSSHLFTSDEAHDVIDLLTANYFERDGCGGWSFEGESFTTIQAADWCARAEHFCAQHR